VKRAVPRLLLLLAGCSSVPLTAEYQPCLIAEYYSTRSFFRTPRSRQKPLLRRVDAQVDFGTAAAAWPGTAIEDHFYIAWSGFLRAPRAGKYTFIMASDDGSRLYINSTKVVDNAGMHRLQERSGETTLEAGDHRIRVEFFDYSGPAACSASWMPPGGDREPIPATALFHREGGVLAPGLEAEIYDVRGDWPLPAPQQEPLVLREESQIDIKRSAGSLLPSQDLASFAFVRWSGFLRVPHDGRYTFWLESSDGSRLIVGPDEVVSNGGLHAMRDASGQAELRQGYVPLQVEYFREEAGEGGCRLSWEHGGRPREIVPAEALFHRRRGAK
jgi:hypothetical protein